LHFFLLLYVKINSLLFPISQLIILAFLLAFQLSYSQLDLSKFVNGFHLPLLDQFALLGTYLGDGIVIVFFCVLVYIFRPELAVAMLLAYLISSGITQGLKHTVFADFHRPLWHIQNLNLSGYYLPENAEQNMANSFPSGHTTSAFAYLCVLAIYFEKKWLKMTFLFLAFFVAFTRVYLLQHFVMDVSVGSLIGTVTAVWVYFALYLKGKFKWAIYARK